MLHLHFLPFKSLLPTSKKFRYFFGARHCFPCYGLCCDCFVNFGVFFHLIRSRFNRLNCCGNFSSNRFWFFYFCCFLSNLISYCINFICGGINGICYFVGSRGNRLSRLIYNIRYLFLNRAVSCLNCFFSRAFCLFFCIWYGGSVSLCFFLWLNSCCDLLYCSCKCCTFYI